jgi:preprotein translocase subunit YajC
MATVIVIAVILALGYFLLAVPQRRRARMHAAMQDSIDVGDEIITAGGLHGIVRELGESELRVEIAPNVVATLDRRAVAAVAEEVRDEVRDEVPSQISDDTPPESG